MSMGMLRGELNWVAKLAGGKLDMTVSADRNRSVNDNDAEYFTAGDALRLTRDWHTNNRTGRHTLRAKYTRSLLEGHALATGIDAGVNQTDETRDRLDQLGAASPTWRVDTFEPKVTRLAGFVQDEWNVTKQWSVYLGTRWEGVRTDSAGTGLADAHSRTHVLSPVAQTLYKFPDKSGRQLRLALTRTFKAPTTDQLTARRYESALNTQFAPDSSGNPALRPELANGVDLTYEHFWAPAALFAVTASTRTITDHIRTRLGQDAQGRWLYQPLNDGKASVRSLQAEVKLPLKMLSPSLAAFDARASINRNWSRVSTVPGPDNRLDEQVPLTANAGIDFKQGNLGLGASFAYQQGGWVKVSEAQSHMLRGRRELDAYLLWKLDPKNQLRLSFGNMLRTDNQSERLYVDATGRSRQASYQAGSMRTQLAMEMKF
ncbi:MAG TPA: TonB-dependent receptor [Telluria sp.]|nr:TonB-dependent receptor [Telluria sp.]